MNYEEAMKACRKLDSKYESIKLNVTFIYMFLGLSIMIYGLFLCTTGIQVLVWLFFSSLPLINAELVLTWLKTKLYVWYEKEEQKIWKEYEEGDEDE